MTNRLLALTAAIALALSLSSPDGPAMASAADAPTATVAPASASQAKKDADCGDFSSQAAAQHYFLSHGGPGSDPDDLDADGDGIACEDNPCPCDYSKNNGGGGTHHTPAKKNHVICLHVAKDGSRTLAVGRVPTLPSGNVKILRRLPHRNYAPFKATRTDSSGKIRKVSLSGPKGTCFEAAAPETKRYKATSKQFVCL